MKKIKIILFALLLNSCASNEVNLQKFFKSHEGIDTGISLSNWEIASSYDSMPYPKHEVMNIKTRETVFMNSRANQLKCTNFSGICTKPYPVEGGASNSTFKMFKNDESYAIEELIRFCEEKFKSKCVVSKRNDMFVFYESVKAAGHYDDAIKLEHYNHNWQRREAAERRREAAEEEKRKFELQRIKEEEDKKMAVIQALKERCINYGFTGNNNIAACVQREAQHDFEIEQKEYELRLTQAKLAALTNQQIQIKEEPPLWLSILGALAEGVAEGYKQQQIINALDQRYEPRDIYRYCRPNC